MRITRPITRPLLAGRRLLSTAPINAALKQLYLCGTHGTGRYKRAKLGQPRVVIAVTGGGGQMMSEMLMQVFARYHVPNLIHRLFLQPGASSCILEAVVPYSKNSCLDFLARNNQSAEGIGFCSEEMAWRLARSARDRAFELENDLNRWPDAHGVSMTATVVSHYKRKGEYRAHAAGVDARGCGSTYTHTMVKGHRNRRGEDLACALLTARALADSTGKGFDKAHGIRLQEEEAMNEVGEVAEGIEQIPARETRKTDPRTSGTYILTGRDNCAICAPTGALPKEAIVVWCESDTNTPEVIKKAKDALVALGRQGDGKLGPWGIMPAPVFVVTSKEHENNVHATLRQELENVAVLVMSGDDSKHCSNFVASARAYSGATFVVDYNEGTHLIDDGSPSTIGVSGSYTGHVVVDTRSTSSYILPHGRGSFSWENGITYEGSWMNGMYHGFGKKMYSKGGGYIGNWSMGKRVGVGVSLYSGKWGYEQWEGPFVDDKPHGMGVMTTVEGVAMEFEFAEGEPEPVAEDAALGTKKPG